MTPASDSALNFSTKNKWPLISNAFHSSQSRVGICTYIKASNAHIENEKNAFYWKIYALKQIKKNAIKINKRSNCRRIKKNLKNFIYNIYIFPAHRRNNGLHFCAKRMHLKFLFFLVDKMRTLQQ